MSGEVAVEVAACRQEHSHVEEQLKPTVSVFETLRAEYIEKIWEDYVCDFLIGSNHVSEAAILDKETGEYLASSSGFQLHEDEFEQILGSLSNSELAYRNGVTVNNKYYKTRLADGSRGIFARSDSEGCSVCKTTTLVIIGVHDENCQPRRCNEEVMRLGDYFFAKGM